MSAMMSSECSIPTDRRIISGRIPPATCCSSLSCCGRVNGQAFGVTNVGQMRQQVHIFNELTTGVGSTFDPEYDHRATHTVELFFVFRIRWIASEARVSYPFHTGMFVQVCCDFHRILTMSFHSQRQRFDSLQKHPCIVYTSLRNAIVWPALFNRLSDKTIHWNSGTDPSRQLWRCRIFVPSGMPSMWWMGELAIPKENWK